MEAIPTRLEPIATRVEDIATKVEAFATRVDCASRFALGTAPALRHHGAVQKHS